MDTDKRYENLVSVLEDVVGHYRHLLELVRNERQILINSNLDDLVENNNAKENLILKIRQLEKTREMRAHEIAEALAIKDESPRLLEIAQKMDMKRGDKLRSIHTALDLLLRRIKDTNIKNESLTQAALENIQGALKNLKSSISEKSVYKKQGELGESKTQIGKFVSREA